MTQRLLELALEQSGATYGCLLLQREGTSSSRRARAPRPEPSRRIGSSSHRSIRCRSCRSRSCISSSRTRDPVIVDDPSTNGWYSNDPYVQSKRPRSILCLPILRQVEVIAVLYLENELVSGAFTRERVTALELIAAQAAIALERGALREARAGERRAPPRRSLPEREPRTLAADHRQLDGAGLRQGRGGALPPDQPRLRRSVPSGLARTSSARETASSPDRSPPIFIAATICSRSRRIVRSSSRSGSSSRTECAPTSPSSSLCTTRRGAPMRCADWPRTSPRASASKTSSAAACHSRKRRSSRPGTRSSCSTWMGVWCSSIIASSRFGARRPRHCSRFAKSSALRSSSPSCETRPP